MKKGMYEENGVILSKKSPKAGETVELRYTGLLKTSGAAAVKAHIGYNENWEDVRTIDMELKDDAFTVSITLDRAGTLNCAFVDPVGSWDNNSGNNYSFRIAKAAAAKKTTNAKTKTGRKETAKAKKTSGSSDTEVEKAKKEAAPAKKTRTTKKSAKP